MSLADNMAAALGTDLSTAEELLLSLDHDRLLLWGVVIPKAARNATDDTRPLILDEIKRQFGQGCELRSA